MSLLAVFLDLWVNPLHQRVSLHQHVGEGRTGEDPDHLNWILSWMCSQSIKTQKPPWILAMEDLSDFQQIPYLFRESLDFFKNIIVATCSIRRSRIEWHPKQNNIFFNDINISLSDDMCHQLPFVLFLPNFLIILMQMLDKIYNMNRILSTDFRHSSNWTTELNMNFYQTESFIVYCQEKLTFILWSSGMEDRPASQ